MKETVALILAAGKGTRMRSDLAKVLHPICGEPMLSYSLAAVQGLGCERVLVVIGHQAKRIQGAFATARVEWVLQSQQRGTADAVRCALPKVADFTGTVLICCGDTPLLTTKTLRAFFARHHVAGAELSVLTMILDNPGSYGRILRDRRGQLKAVVEAKDAGEEERGIQEVNTGVYCARADLLRAVIPAIDSANAQGEYYLTDLVHKAVEQGWKVQTVVAADPKEFLGINTREELAAVTAVIATRTRSPRRERGQFSRP